MDHGAVPDGDGEFLGGGTSPDLNPISEWFA
jgi:hypothetical protein